MLLETNMANKIFLFFSLLLGHFAHLYSSDIVVKIEYKCCEKGTFQSVNRGYLLRDTSMYFIDKTGSVTLPDTGLYWLNIGELDVRYKVYVDYRTYSVKVMSADIAQIGLKKPRRKFRKVWPWMCKNGHLYDGYVRRYQMDGTPMFIGIFKRGKAIFTEYYHENGNRKFLAEFDKKGLPIKQIWYDENGKVTNAY